MSIWLSCWRTLVLFPFFNLNPISFFFCTFALQSKVRECSHTHVTIPMALGAPGSEQSSCMFLIKCVNLNKLPYFLTPSSSHCYVRTHLSECRVAIKIQLRSVEGLELCLALGGAASIATELSSIWEGTGFTLSLIHTSKR